MSLKFIKIKIQVSFYIDTVARLNTTTYEKCNCSLYNLIYILCFQFSPFDLGVREAERNTELILSLSLSVSSLLYVCTPGPLVFKLDPLSTSQ